MDKEFKTGNTVIRVVKGDITKVEADAIVNPANSLMIMGGGVASAIKRVGGDDIEFEARRHAPVPIGEAVVTSGGKLRAKYVIHAPTMERPAMRTNEAKVRAAVRAALRRAHSLGLRSIAFPGMGTGVGGLDPNVAAKAMIEEVINFLKRGGRISEVLLVAFTDDLYRAFINAASNLLKTY